MAPLRAGLLQEPLRRLGQARAQGGCGAGGRGGRGRRRHDAADVHRLQHRPQGGPGHGGAAQGIRPTGRRCAAAQVALRAREPARRILRDLVPPLLHRRPGQEARCALQRPRQVCQGEALQDVAGQRARDPPHHQGRHRISAQRLHRPRGCLQGNRQAGQDRRRQHRLRGHVERAAMRMAPRLRAPAPAWVKTRDSGPTDHTRALRHQQAARALRQLQSPLLPLTPVDP
mmetsp:Transcript_8188/g.19346  ORF Transcript_8188/g.19346 Transcript_8188/m.19346 type:complete len:229 (+) Transcript_8188:357-1043(+)